MGQSEQKSHPKSNEPALAKLMGVGLGSKVPKIRIADHGAQDQKSKGMLEDGKVGKQAAGFKLGRQMPCEREEDTQMQENAVPMTRTLFS